MSATTFSKRFRELVRDISDTELGHILGVTADAARKMRNGDITSMKLHAALRLARALRVSPWYLAGEAEPPIPLRHGPPPAAKAKGSKSLERAQLETADAALLMADELTELRSRLGRVERAVQELQSRAGVSSEL